MRFGKPRRRRTLTDLTDQEICDFCHWVLGVCMLFDIERDKERDEIKAFVQMWSPGLQTEATDVCLIVFSTSGLTFPWPGGKGSLADETTWQIFLEQHGVYAS